MNKRELSRAYRIDYQQIQFPNGKPKEVNDFQVIALDASLHEYSLEYAEAVKKVHAWLICWSDTICSVLSIPSNETAIFLGNSQESRFQLASPEKSYKYDIVVGFPALALAIFHQLLEADLERKEFIPLKKQVSFMLHILLMSLIHELTHLRLFLKNGQSFNKETTRVGKGFKDKEGEEFLKAYLEYRNSPEEVIARTVPIKFFVHLFRYLKNEVNSHPFDQLLVFNLEENTLNNFSEFVRYLNSMQGKNIQVKWVHI